MKNQLLDIKAALLYLLFFQTSEEGHTVESYNQCQRISKELIQMGYPDPEEIIYDNEGIPLVLWKSESFDCSKFYEFIDYDPTYFENQGAYQHT